MPRGATEAHAPQLLSLHATTTGFCLPERMLCSKRSHSNEKPAHLNAEEPPLTNRESLHTARKTQNNHKHKSTNFKKESDALRLKKKKKKSCCSAENHWK